MFAGLAELHGLLLRGCLWLLKQPFLVIAGTIKASIVLLGEEARRWAGVVVAGVIVLVICRVLLWAMPDRQLAMLTVLLLGMGWLAAAFKAAQHTADNSLYKSRQRQWARKLSGEVVEVRERLSVGAAKAARGTPFEGAFRTNRDRADQEQADAQAAAQQAETQRQEAEERERRLDEMTALEPNPYETQPR